MKPGRAASMTHDYKRNGTTTLFAAMHTPGGIVISRCEQRHRHVEWPTFLRQIDRETPQDNTLHLVCDNCATHKHPRLHVPFTPTSASWPNMVERFFRDTTTGRLRSGVFRSVPELTGAIKEYIAVHNKNPKPFIWTAKAQDILAKVIRANSRFSSKKNEAIHWGCTEQAARRLSACRITHIVRPFARDWLRVFLIVFALRTWPHCRC